MKLCSALVIALVSLVALGAVAVHADDDFRADYSAVAPGDDPNTTGQLELEIDDDDDDDGDENDAVEYRATLFNAIDVTGIHLHLQGNSSNGLFGGPLVLALTNTTAANGQQPVSSVGTEALRQEGRRSSGDLRANPQAALVQARLAELGVTGNDLQSPAQLIDLIKRGLIYTDVHTLTAVSPAGLTRGLVRDADDVDDGDDDASSSDD